MTAANLPAGLPRLAVALLGFMLAPAIPAAPAPADAPPPADKGKADPESSAVVVRFADDGVLRLTLREDKITLLTDYGKLEVPVADVLKIEFATRVPEGVAKKIEAAVSKLGSDDFAERERASADLRGIGARAYPALTAALKDGDAEARRRAQELIDRLRESVPAEQLEVRERDVIYTKDSKIAGRMAGSSWKATSAQFGDVQLRLADVRSLHAPGFGEQAAVQAAALPDPGSLTGYANKFGTRAAFTVSGQAAGGSVWGAGLYTLDSSLATAAVHAGALRAGETGVVRVEILAPPPGFNGTTQNGVTTSTWGAYPDGAFRFILEGK